MGDLGLKHLASLGELGQVVLEGRQLLGVQAAAFSVDGGLTAQALAGIAQGVHLAFDDGDALLMGLHRLGDGGAPLGDVADPLAQYLQVDLFLAHGGLGSLELCLAALPLMAIPDALELFQVLAQEQVLFGALGLAAQRAGARHELVDQVAYALQVALGLGDAAQGLFTAAQVRRDAGGLFKEGAAGLGTERQGGVDLALADGGIAAAG